MKSLLMVLVLMTTFNAAAVEISAAPLLGYSDYYGGTVGLGAWADFSLNDHWQLGGGVMYYTSPFGKLFSDYGSNYEVLLGPTYNFSEDLQRSLFIGAGIGYSNRLPTPGDAPSALTYIKFGKRFLLSETYHITYKPEVQLIGGGNGAHGLNLNILNFSIQF